MLKYTQTSGNPGLDQQLSEMWTDLDRVKHQLPAWNANVGVVGPSAAAAAAPVVVTPSAPAASLTVSQADGTQSGPVLVLEFDATTGETVTQGDSSAVITNSGIWTQATPELRLVENTGSTYSRWNRNSSGTMEFLTEGAGAGTGYALGSPSGNNYATFNSFGALTNFTVEHWSKVYASGSASAFLSYLGGGSDDNANWEVLRNGSNLTLQYRLGYTSNYVSYNGTINVFDGNWHHVAITYNGTTFAAYVDGALDVSATPSITLYTAAGSGLSIGSRNGAFPITGRIDELKIYTVAKTQAQVQADYNAGAGVYGITPDTSIYSGYHFDETSGTTCADYTGNGRTLTKQVATYNSGLVTATSSSFEAEVSVIQAVSGSGNDVAAVLTYGNTASSVIVTGRTIEFEGLNNTAGAPAMSIDENGWIGFGTNLPQGPLTMAGSGTIVSFLNGTTQLFSFAAPGNLVVGGSQTFQIVNSTGTAVLQVAGAGLIVAGTYLTCSNGGIELPGGTGTSGIFTSGYASNIGLNNWLTVSAASSHLLQPLSDSTTAISVATSSGSNIFVNFDTTNQQVAIGQAGAPNSTLQVGGSISLPITATPLTSNANIGSSNSTVLANATSGALTMTLPTAIGIGGRLYVVKKTDASANTVTIATTSSQTIDGATTKVISAQYSLYEVQSDGANWQIVGKM